MHHNIFVRALLFLSKTDPALYDMCPQGVKWTRTALGAFVLFTALFAFVTGSYFVRTLFMEYNENTQTLDVTALGQVVSFAFGLLWGLVVLFIDREIVSSSSRWVALLRLPLAVAIGLAIAIPFKVQFFSDRIQKELVVASQAENSSQRKQRDEYVSSVRQNIAKYEAGILESREQMAHWSAAMEAEVVGRQLAGRTGRSGEGPAYREAERNLLLHKDLADNYQKQLDDLRSKEELRIREAQTAYEQSRVRQSFDFLSQYEQMENIKSGDKRLKNFALLLTLLFIIIETIPALMKLLKEEDEYDALSKSRSRVSIQLINASSNVALNEIEKNIQSHVLVNGSAYKYSPKELMDYIQVNL